MIPLTNSRPADSLSLARAALDVQLAHDRRHFGISLDALWRAGGSPEGETPTDWRDLAQPLLNGFAGYRRRLHAATAHERPHDFIPVEPTWPLDQRTLAAVVAATGDAGPLRVGDWMAFEEVAEVYAAFLDRRGLRRNHTRAGASSYDRHLTRTADGPRFASPEPRPRVAEVVTA